MSDDKTRSPLGERIRAKAAARNLYEFEVQGYFGLGEAVEKVAIRVPTKREQDMALAGAHAYIAKMSAKIPSLATDPDMVLDAKGAFIVAACCLDPSTPEHFPIWPTGEVAQEDMTADQIGVLVRLLNEVRAKDGPTPDTLDEQQVEAFVSLAVAGADTEVPDKVLTPLRHPYLVQLYILTALKLQEARTELEALRQQFEALRAEPDVPG